MFGHTKSQTTVGPATVQNPSMLDNVNSGDFEEGANPAITEVEKQVQAALAVHDQTHVGQTMTDDPAVGTTSATPMMTSGSDVPTAIPAPVTDDPATDSDEDETSSATTDIPAVEPSVTAEVEVATPKPPTAPLEEPLKTGLASTVPGIKVEEAPSTDDATEPVSPSAPVEPPAAPEVTEEPIGAQQPELEVEVPAASPDVPAEETVPDTEASQSPQADETSIVDLETPETVVVAEESEAPAEEVAAPTPEEPVLVPELSAPEETVSENSEESVEEAKPQGAFDVTPVAVVASTVPAVDTDKLAGLKKHALDHLEPLAETLDQSPEDEFKTTMMRIQANDNHTLLDKALKAAKAIPDDQARARALLDIVNEINYFSSQDPGV